MNGLRRGLRLVLLGPFMLFFTIGFTVFGWLMDDRDCRHWPRWMWQLLWYGHEQAMEMRGEHDRWLRGQ